MQLKHTTPRHVAQVLATETLSDEPNPPAKNKSWGYHLLVDCSSCNEKIDDEEAITEFIDLIINELKMKKLSDLILERVDGEDGRGHLCNADDHDVTSCLSLR